MKRHEGESFVDYKKRSERNILRIVRAKADTELEEYLKVTRKEFKKLWGINE